MHYLYIVQCADGTYYTGIAKNVEQRLERHRSGRGAKYLRGRMPFELVYTEECADLSSAMKREIAVKKLSRTDKQALIKTYDRRTS